MALKSAKAGGLNVGSGMDKAKGWFDATWEGANQQAGLNPIRPLYEDISIFPYAEKQESWKQH